MEILKTQHTRGIGLFENFLAKQRAKKAKQLITRSRQLGSILDIGCGSRPFFLLNTQFSQKYGLDKFKVNRGYFNKCGINYIEQDLESLCELPLVDQSLDVVTMLAIVEHLIPKQLPILFNEIYRVLKPGGVLVITTPASWTGWLLKILSKLYLVSPIEVSEHKHNYTSAELKALLVAAGFSLNAIQYGYFELVVNMWITASKSLQ